MSVSLPNGSLFAIASSYGSALTVSAATNANPCVMTSTAHGLTNGDYVEVTAGGWTRLNARILRVSGITANTFELEGYDASSTTTHPAGTGTGSVRKITAWTQISQVLSTSTSGGEQQFATYQFIEADIETRIPTTKAAGGLDMEVADDPTLAGYIAALAANNDRAARAIRVTLANSSKILYNSYISIDQTPSLTVNNVMAVKMTLSFLSPPIRYAT